MKHSYLLQVVTAFIVLFSSCNRTEDIAPHPADVSAAKRPPAVVVILGSSTAQGFGATAYSRSWAGLLASDLRNTKVINLARGGYTTYHMLPNGSVPEKKARPVVDTLRNITAALRHNPTHIIISMTTNDVSLGYSVDEVMQNLETVWQVAQEAGVEHVLVSTSLPRKLSATATRRFKEQRTRTLQRFGASALNFFDVVAGMNGQYKPQFNADGIHPNDNGHRALYQELQRVLLAAGNAPVRRARSPVPVTQ